MGFQFCCLFLLVLVQLSVFPCAFLSLTTCLKTYLYGFTVRQCASFTDTYICFEGYYPMGPSPASWATCTATQIRMRGKSGVYFPVTSFKNLFSLPSSILFSIQTFLFQSLSGYRLLWKRWLSFLGLSIFKAFKNIFYQLHVFNFGENVNLNNLAYYFNKPDMTVTLSSS